MPLDPKTLEVTVPAGVAKPDPNLVKLLGGPLGGRLWGPVKPEEGLRIVVGNDGQGRKMKPVVYEVFDGHDRKTGQWLARYAGFATEADLRRR